MVFRKSCHITFGTTMDEEGLNKKLDDLTSTVNRLSYQFDNYVSHRAAVTEVYITSVIIMSITIKQTFQSLLLWLDCYVLVYFNVRH